VEILAGSYGAGQRFDTPPSFPCNTLQHQTCETVRFYDIFTGRLKILVCVVVVLLSCMFGV
jgi:hypothetical protein